MVSFNVKNMIYRQLNPIANVLNLKLLILDYESYSSFGKKLDVKLDSLGLSKDSIDELNDALSNYPFIAILKSKNYIPYDDIVAAFSKFGMKDNDLKFLSTRQSEDKVFGSFDDKIPDNKKIFFYWFPIDIENID